MNIVRPLLALLLLAGCGQSPPPTPAPLAGSSIGGPFALTDQDGRARTDRDFAGRWRIVYFGYTNCPDVCPTDVAAIGAGLKRAEGERPALAGRIVPIFVTVDPRRDTPPVLRQFVAAFHPRMVGLTGDPAAIARVAKGYAAFYTLHEPNAAGAYLVDHSRQAYLMDPDGKPIALLPADEGAAAVATEIERWVS